MGSATNTKVHQRHVALSSAITTTTTTTTTAAPSSFHKTNTNGNHHYSISDGYSYPPSSNNLGMSSSSTSSLLSPFSTTGKRRTPRKKRRRPNYSSGMKKEKLLWPLLWFGLCGITTLFGWNIFWERIHPGNTGGDDSSSFSSSSSITTPNFALSSDTAPQCTPLSSMEEIDFTLVTQLSDNRLWMMEYHCQRFPHAISIAVYTNRTVHEIQEQLKTMGCIITPDKVQVAVLSPPPPIIPTVETSTSSNDEDEVFAEYPVNTLRNMALSNVRTSHLIYIDVDFWTSSDLYDILMMESSSSSSSSMIRRDLFEDSKLALVLPAFMLFRQCHSYKDCQNQNIPLMPSTKDQVLKMMINKHGHIFDPTNRGGHGSTRYKEWIRQERGRLLNIPCLLSHRYEPFVITRWCRDLPPFQTAFTGYGKNKLSWMMHVVRKGYTLKQVGGAFVVHYPHLDSPARTKWNQAPEDLKVPKKGGTAVQLRRPTSKDGNLHLESFKRGQVDRLYVQFRNWLESTVPDESRVGMCDKAQDDDSKLWIDKNNKEKEGDDEETFVTHRKEKLEQEAAAVHQEGERQGQSFNDHYLGHPDGEEYGEKGSDEDDEDDEAEGDDDDKNEIEQEQKMDGDNEQTIAQK